MVKFHVLGPVAASADGEPLNLGGPKQRAVLAMLLARRPQPVSSDLLAGAVYGDQLPDRARRRIQTYVSTLRSIVGEAIVKEGDGWSLRVADEQVDAARFERLYESAIGRESKAVSETLREALSLWRGAPFAEVEAHGELDAEITRLNELRVTVLHARIEADLDIGRHSEVIGELESLIDEHPYHEQFRAQHMLALYRSGRQRDALRSFAQLRERLVDELGVDPSPELQHLERRVLDHDDTLLTPRTPTAPIAAVETPGDAPSGDVTFVFTDIEGSTAHLVRLGDDYPLVLDHHRSILRAAWGAHDGYEVNTEGDSFFVAFREPTAAVTACIEAQRGLGAFDWPDGPPIRVRMGVHRGHAIPRSGDYAALAVHRAARIASAAAGSQILVSADVALRCGDLGGPTLSSVGDWRVRDFDEPVELFVVLDPESGLSSALPLLVPASGHNIVLPRNRFVGRDVEMEILRQEVGAGRIVTVVGPGGVGKTRLVQELCVELCEGWPDGVWFVPLERVVDGHDVSTALLSVIGLIPGPEGDGSWQGSLEKLRSMHALIVLDNCEHVAEAAAEVIGDLLVGSDSIGVVATSRHSLVGTRPLGIDEATLRLEPLSTSSFSDTSPAHELFVARAGLLGWEPDAAEHDAIDRLCTQVDGLPLAIEIVAPWIEMMGADELCHAFADPEHRRMIESGARRSDDRSVSSVIESSLGRLDPPLREVLSAVSILPSSFSVHVAQHAVNEPDDAIRTKLSLFELVTRSLVISDRSEGSSRYRLLRTIRQHVLEHLPPQQRSEYEYRTSSYYCSTLGPEQSADRRWVAEMSAELENVSALRSARGAKLEHRFELAWSLGNFRDGTGRFSAGIDELTWFLDGEPEGPPERAAINALLAYLALRVGDVDGAATYLAEAERLAAQVGLPSWDDAAIIVTKAALALWRGDIDGCGRIASAGLSQQLSVGGRARIHDVRGIALMQAGDVVSAATEFAAEVDLWRDLGAETKLCTALGNLAEAYLQLDELALAARHQRECLRLARELGQDVWIAHSMTMAAQLSARFSQWSQSLALQHAADGEYERIGLRMFASDEVAREELRARAAVLGEADAIDEDAMRPTSDAMNRAEFVELASKVLDDLLSR